MPDAGAAADAAPAEDATVAVDPDAGPPPKDFECHDPWTQATKKDPACAARTVVTVTSFDTKSETGVSIARAPSGRIGISFHQENAGTIGSLWVAHFERTSKSGTSPKPELVERHGAVVSHTGWLSRIAASGDDAFTILSYDWDDTSEVGNVSTVQLVDGAGPLTTPALVLAAVKQPSEMGFAIGQDGTAFAAVRQWQSDTTAKLIVLRHAPQQDWEPLPEVPSQGLGLAPSDAPGAGSSALVVDAAGTVHLLYHFNESQFPFSSMPRYFAFGGGDWTYRKTIDNNVPEGLCGFSPRLAVRGAKKYAAYFFRKNGQDTIIDPTAELHLATWSGADDEPKRELIDSSLPANTIQAPRYRVAMAVDKFGLVHLAFVRPIMREDHGRLEYRRQQRTDGGDVTWLSDIIDDDVLSTETAADVDLIVDDDARPHIAYRSGKDGLVRYATRTDR